jgi:serine/threonine protein kinase
MPGVKQVAGRYELIRELGRGGMATVYLARQIDLSRLVALKELGALRTTDQSFAKRFLREAQLAGSLSHPNIVTVHDYFSHGDIPYIAMEYLERGSLRPYVGRMSLSQVGGVLDAVLAGLARAEKHGIVHRDLKPENLLVTAEGTVKISDFGIAKATSKLQTGALALTSTGVAVGTPNYMAPEQATAQGVGPWTDLYSVGIMAFEFLVGRPPFGDTEQAMAVLLRQVNEAIPAVNEIDQSIDSSLSDWIARMVAKDPAARPQSAGAAADELEETLIRLLGPRWRRTALLAPEVELTLGFLPPDHDALFDRRATAPLDDQPLSATVSPRLPPLPPDPDGPTLRAPRRRWAGRAPKLIVAAVAVVAASAAILGRGGGTQTSVSAAAPAASVRSTASATTTASLPATGVSARVSSTTAQAGLAAEGKTARKLAGQYESAASRIARLSGAKISGSPTARLASAMRRTAAAYRSAAAAAAAGDLAGYTSAIQAAATGKKAVQVALAAMRAAAGVPASSSPAQQSQPSQPPVAPTPCSGDSVSDDPSDESCGGP